MKLPKIVYVRADLKETNKQLKRLADGLEALLRVAFNIHMTPTSPDRSSEEDEVSYIDDVRLAVQEVEDEDMSKDKPLVED